MNIPGLGDVYGYVTGYRTWTVKWMTPDMPCIFGRTMASTEWPAGKPMKACCLDACDRGAAIPSLGIKHGIYAHKEPIASMMSERESVMGEVALWGEIHEHENGYRTQYAYPLCFYHIDKDVSEVATRYGVEMVDPPAQFYREIIGSLSQPRATMVTMSTAPLGNSSPLAGLAGALGQSAGRHIDDMARNALFQRQRYQFDPRDMQNIFPSAGAFMPPRPIQKKASFWERIKW